MPRILYISAHCPHGPAYGAQLRSLHIARILKTCGELGMVLIPFREIDVATLRRVGGEFDLRAVLYLDKAAPQNILSRLRREVDPYAADTQGGMVGERSSMLLDEIVKDFDIVWFHGIAIPNSLGRRRWPCSVLDVDDIKSHVYTGIARGTGSAASRIMAMRQAILWRRRESVLLDRFGVINVCSEPDKRALGASDRIHVVPNGFEVPSDASVRTSHGPPRIGFIGTLEYSPNLYGLRWFINQVWPLVKLVRRDARLRLVGMNTESGIAGDGPDIDGLGFVDDVSSEIAGWAASIVPINLGGGTRIKIAESFSKRCPVVSTSLGAYGYMVESGRECLIADSAADMASACLRLMDDRAYGDELARCAWERFCAEWSWEAISPRVRRSLEAGLVVGREGARSRRR